MLVLQLNPYYTALWYIKQSPCIKCLVAKVPKFFALKYYNYFHLSACLYCLLTVLNSLLNWNHTIKLRVVNVSTLIILIFINVSTLSSNFLNTIQIVSLLWRVRKNITHDHHASHMLVNLYYAVTPPFSDGDCIIQVQQCFSSFFPLMPVQWTSTIKISRPLTLV